LNPHFFPAVFFITKLTEALEAGGIVSQPAIVAKKLQVWVSREMMRQSSAARTRLWCQKLAEEADVSVRRQREILGIYKKRTFSVYQISISLQQYHE
jgi:hypothetical protein